MYTHIRLLLIGFFICLYGLTDAQGTVQGTVENDVSNRMKWFREAKLGMFIHWGVYSALEGEYSGTSIDGTWYTEENPFKCTGGAEWILYQAKIPRAKYREYASLFTANNFDANHFVEVAHTLGAKYIVLTVKHHEGFLLYPSSHSDWSTLNSGAQGRDLVGELQTATKQAGLKFGIYFSQNLDWFEEGSFGLIPELDGKGYGGEMNRKYVEKTCRILDEIMWRYGRELDMIFWDLPSLNWSQEFSDMIKYTIINHPYYRPDILQNDRLSIWEKGDYDTPEEGISSLAVRRDSEMCITISGSWGYSRYARTNKSQIVFVDRLLNCVSKGCNLLFNLPPRGDGSFDKEVIESVRKYGEYVHANAESIYGVTNNGFEYGQDCGRVTRKDNILYLHYYVGDKCELRGVEGKIISAQKNGVPVEFISVDKGYRFIGVKRGEVVKVEFEDLIIDEYRRIGNESEELTLSSMVAQSYGNLFLDGLDLQYPFYGNWVAQDSYLSWPLEITSEGEYELYATLSCVGYNQLRVDIQDKELLYDCYSPHGSIHFDEYRMGSFHLKPERSIISFFGLDNPQMRISNLRIKKKADSSISKLSESNAFLFSTLFRNKFSISCPVGGEYRFEIYSLTGDLVFSHNKVLSDEEICLCFFPNIPEGIYLFAIRRNGILMKQEKIIKL